MKLKLRENMLLIIYIVYILSVLWSQITINDETRIGVPIKEVATLLISIYFITNINKIKTTRLYFIVFSFVAINTINALIINQGKKIEEFSIFYYFIYIFIYNIGIIHLAKILDLRDSKLYFDVTMAILSVNSYIALILFILFFIGLNPIMLGVNNSGYYRLFGLMAEPSHFSIVSGMTLMLRLYFTYHIAYFEKNNLKLILLFSSFILSQSPTGFSFIALSVLIFFFITLESLNNKIKYIIVSSCVMLSMLFFMEDIDTVTRGYERITYDIETLLDYLKNNNSVDVDMISEHSRVLRLLVVTPFLYSLNIYEILFGVGMGGQVAVLPTTSLFFGGLLYVLVEFGVIGSTLLFFIFKRRVQKVDPFIGSIIIGYICICFVNAPGGIFGLQFIVMVIFLLISNKHLLVMKRLMAGIKNEGDNDGKRADIHRSKY